MSAADGRYFGKYGLQVGRIALRFQYAGERENKISGLENFYPLVHEVAARLVGAHASKMDVALDDCLAKVGEYFDASQVGLGQTSKTGELLPALRAWGHSATTYLSAPPPGRDMVDVLRRNGSLIWN